MGKKGKVEGENEVTLARGCVYRARRYSSSLRGVFARDGSRAGGLLAGVYEMRRTLLGLVGVVAVCGAATAKPPLSEGREVDPGVRDFQLGGPPVAVEEAAPSPAPAKPGDVFGWALLLAFRV